MKRYIFVAAAVALCLWQCTTAEVQPLQYAAPVAEFPSDVPETISLSVGDSYTFSVNFTEGEKLTKEWRVNGLLEASTDKLTYTFNEPGTFTVSFKAYNGSGSIEHSYTVTVDDKLEIHLSVGDSTAINRVEESRLQLYAIVDKGQNVTHSWKIDGEEKCTEAYFDTYLPKNVSVDGDVHRIDYVGTNAAGSIAKTFTVKAENRPLQIDFQEHYKRAFTFTVNISADIQYGGAGASHRWYIGDDLVSESDEITYILPSLGTYYVKYKGLNAKGEIVEKEWTIVYDEYLADFNDGKFSEMFQIHNSNASYLKTESLSVVDSPYKNDGHGKVLCWHVDSKNKTRGGFLFRKEYFDNHGIDLSQFKGIKLTGRLDSDEGELSATARRTICLAFESDYSNEYKTLSTIKKGDADAGLDDPDNPGKTFEPWGYICKPKWINFQYNMSFSGDGTIKVYPACTWNKTTVVSGNYAYVYIDDIILFK